MINLTLPYNDIKCLPYYWTAISSSTDQDFYSFKQNKSVAHINAHYKVHLNRNNASSISFKLCRFICLSTIPLIRENCALLHEMGISVDDTLLYNDKEASKLFGRH